MRIALQLHPPNSFAYKYFREDTGSNFETNLVFFPIVIFCPFPAVLVEDAALEPQHGEWPVMSHDW